jgi:hypothetical protein
VRRMRVCCVCDCWLFDEFLECALSQQRYHRKVDEGGGRGIKHCVGRGKMSIQWLMRGENGNKFGERNGMNGDVGQR